jgi:hypothetical protein
MAQKDWLRKKVKIHIRDVNMSESELDGIIDTVLTEIALETRLFKKLYGFTVHADIEKYNFRYLARMNEQVEEEPGNIVLGDITPGDLAEFISNGVFPEIPVDKNLEVDPYQSQFLDLLDIFDEDGNSVLDKFEERGSSYYFVYDEEWRKKNDDKRFVFSGWVKPDINELHDEDLSIILHTVIAGCKFYVNDTLHSPEDTGATNYDFMRWFQGKENLMNRFPTSVYSTRENNRWL